MLQFVTETIVSSPAVRAAHTLTWLISYVTYIIANVLLFTLFSAIIGLICVCATALLFAQLRESSFSEELENLLELFISPACWFSSLFFIREQLVVSASSFLSEAVKKGMESQREKLAQLTGNVSLPSIAGLLPSQPAAILSSSGPPISSSSETEVVPVAGSVPAHENVWLVDADDDDDDDGDE